MCQDFKFIKIVILTIIFFIFKHLLLLWYAPFRLPFSNLYFKLPPIFSVKHKTYVTFLLKIPLIAFWYNSVQFQSHTWFGHHLSSSFLLVCTRINALPSVYTELMMSLGIPVLEVIPCSTFLLHLAEPYFAFFKLPGMK